MTDPRPSTVDVDVPLRNGALQGTFARPAGPARGALVLLHGFASTRAEFGDAPERLAAKGWVALAVDARAHGRDAALEGTMDLAFAVEDVEAALAFLRKEAGDAPAGIVAHSMGGALAAYVLPRVPALKAAALVAPLDTARAELSAVEFLAYRAIDRLSRASVRRGGAPIGVAYRTRYEDLFDDREAAKRAKAAPFLAERVSFANYDSLFGIQGAAWAREVTVPTLVVLAKNDRRVKAANSRRVYDALAGPKKLVQLECGHSAFGDLRAGELVDALDAWFSERLR